MSAGSLADTSGCWSELTSHSVGGYRDTLLRDLSYLPDLDPPVVAGNAIRRYDRTRVDHPPLVVSATGNTRLGRPSGSFRFLAPRLRAGPGGQLHLVWGEPFSAGADSVGRARAALYPAPRRAWRAERPRSLWYSRYRRGEWSAPEPLIADAPYLTWSPVGGKVFVDRNDRVHVATGTASEGLYLRIDDGQVDARATRRRGTYPNLLVEGDTLYEAWASQPPASSPDGRRAGTSSQVYLRRSHDGGEYFSEPLRIGPAAHGERAVHDLHLTNGGSRSGPLQLTWLQREPRREVLHTATVSPADWQVSGGIDTVAMPDRAVTNVHVVSWAPERTAVFYISPNVGLQYRVYRDGEWGAVVTPFPARMLVVMDVVVADRLVHLFGYEQLDTDTEERAGVRAVAATYYPEPSGSTGCAPGGNGQGG